MSKKWSKLTRREVVAGGVAVGLVGCGRTGLVDYSDDLAASGSEDVENGRTAGKRSIQA